MKTNWRGWARTPQPKVLQIKRLCNLFIRILLFLMFLISVESMAVAADDSKVVRVGIYENQPKIFTDDKGIASGFWPDIIKYVASQESWKIEYIHGTWAECLKRLENNEIDIMPDVAFSEERNKTYAFSRETVYTSWSKVYTQKGSGIQSIIDLKGKTIAVLKGSVNVDGPDGIKTLAKLFDIDCTFTEVDSYTRVFELVESGKADAGVTSKDFGNQNETIFNVVGTAIIFQPASLYFSFPKNSSLTSYLVDRIDHHIKILKHDNNSVYYQSLDKWLAIKPDVKPVTPMWVIWLLIGIGVLALLLVAGSLILRSQIRSKTKALTEEILRHNRAEEALRTNERSLASIYETVGDVIFLLAVERSTAEEDHITYSFVDGCETAFVGSAQCFPPAIVPQDFLGKCFRL